MAEKVSEVRGTPAAVDSDAVVSIRRLVHDARQPISGVTAFLESIESDGWFAADIREIAARAAVDAHAALDLISGWLPGPAEPDAHRAVPTTVEHPVTDLATAIDAAVASLIQSHTQRLAVSPVAAVLVGYPMTSLAKAINAFVAAALRHGRSEHVVYLRTVIRQRQHTATVTIAQPEAAEIRPGWVDTAGLLSAVAIIVRGGGTTCFGNPGQPGMQMRVVLPLVTATQRPVR